MTPSQVRSELLRQHADLRQLMEAAREIARRVREGESLRRQLQASTLRLADALNAHNRREEELLPALTADGGWAPADPEGVNQRHFEEHKTLHGALVEVSTEPNAGWVAGHLVLALDTLLEHMANEERTFLHHSLLHDDEPDTDPYGGRPLGTGT